MVGLNLNWTSTILQYLHVYLVDVFLEVLDLLDFLLFLFLALIQ